MENIILQFLNVYFWVFIVMFSFNIIGKFIIKTLKPEYEFKDTNDSFLSKIIVIVLFILSIVLT